MFTLKHRISVLLVTVMLLALASGALSPLFLLPPGPAWQDRQRRHSQPEGNQFQGVEGFTPPAVVHIGDTGLSVTTASSQ